MEHGEIQLAADSLQEAANMLEVGGALRGFSVVSGPLLQKHGVGNWSYACGVIKSLRFAVICCNR